MDVSVQHHVLAALTPTGTEPGANRIGDLLVQGIESCQLVTMLTELSTIINYSFNER